MMDKKSIYARIARFLKLIYLKLFRINDAPQKIAIGFGIGVFFGVMPGVGPVAALAAAFLLRVNRASAILGSLLTNTWISIPVFLLSLKAGALIAGLKFEELQSQWGVFVKQFRWSDFLNISVYGVIAPILAGYLVVSFFIGLISYFTVLAAVIYFKNRKKNLKNQRK
jgi:uncharacterized protein